MTIIFSGCQLQSKLKDNPIELYEYNYHTEKQLKDEFKFLKEVDSIALQQTRMNLSIAYQKLFQKVKRYKNSIK